MVSFRRQLAIIDGSLFFGGSQEVERKCFRVGLNMNQTLDRMVLVLGGASGQWM